MMERMCRRLGCQRRVVKFYLSLPCGRVLGLLEHGRHTGPEKSEDCMGVPSKQHGAQVEKHTFLFQSSFSPQAEMVI